jgi:hypothetical protein
MRVKLMGGWRTRVLRAVVVLVLAGIGYVLFIPQSQVDRQLLGNLVITRTTLPGVPHKAKLEQSVKPSQSSFAVTRKAGRENPDETGVYAREWYVSSAAPPEVGVVLQLLPTESQAHALLPAVVAQLHTAPQLSGETASAPESFSIPGVPSARGESYLLSDSSTSPPKPVGSAYTDVFQHDRAVVSELMVSTSATRDTSAAVADALAETRLLEQNLPGFSMVTTTYPLTATAVYAAVTVVLAAAALLLPEFVVAQLERRRERRDERARRREREQYLARGRRTVRRQRAPAWSQHRRR